MIKKLAIILSFVIFGLSPVFAYAQNTATTAVTSPVPLNEKTPVVLRGELKDAASSLKYTIVKARDEYKTKLSAIKDAKKQKIVANIDDRIKKINAKRTDEMSRRIERLTSILNTISTQEASLKLEGKNTVTLTNNIANATIAINNAKEAVQTQMEKDYVMQITTDDALKSTAQDTIAQFISDLKVAHTKVSTARESVLAAYKTSKSLSGVTPSPTLNVQP